jgi:hypothetical protein
LFRLGTLGIALVAIALLPAARANAATVTLGADLSVAPTTTFGCGTPTGCTYSQATPAYVSPVSGLIVRWRLRGSTGPFTLRVLRGNTGIASSASATSPSPAIQEFPTSLPISAGDRLGIDMPTGFVSNLGIIEPAGASIDTWESPLGNGETRAPGIVFSPFKMLMNAEVLVAPSASSVNPVSGPIGSPTPVTISGQSLGAVTGVKFNGVPVAFIASSDTQVSAYAPPSATPGPVGVTVATPAGTTQSLGFTYTACAVPKLKGKSLKADRKKLRNAGCKLGKVKGKRGKAAKVVGQSQKPGSIVPPGTAINVRLGGA